MATKKKAAEVTWNGESVLRVVLKDGSQAFVAKGESFEPDADWLKAVKSRQPEKAKLLK
jgi:hypothetical protein